MTTKQMIRGVLMITLVAVCSAGASAADPVPDPDATRALEDLVRSYRARPFLEVKATLQIGLQEGDMAAEGEKIVAEFLAAKGGSGRVKIRDFTCYFHGDEFTVVHAKNDEEYYQEKLDGSAYWLLFDTFREMAYPHIAILWGEPGIEDVLMQLQPQTPDLVPTEVQMIETEVGAKRQRIELAGPSGTMVMHVDPKTKLVQRIEHDITSGAFVQGGTKRHTVYTYTYPTLDAPPKASAFAFAPGARQRIDLVAALVPAAPPPGAPGGLIGRPAPPFVLATTDGGAVDLEDLRGKVVVLDFWATWCGPCRRALPMLHEVADWAKQEELPVTVLAINVWEIRDPQRDSPDARRESATAFWRKQGFTLPVAMDYSDETAAAYGVRGIPATFVIRSDGVVHAQPHADPETLKQAISGAIDALEAPIEDAEP